MIGMEPYQIEHLVEVIGTDGQIDQLYNDFVYKFQDGSAYVWAWAYLDDMGTASIFGPFKSETDLTPVENSSLVNGVIEYMKMRYPNLQAFGPNGYVKIP